MGEIERRSQQHISQHTHSSRQTESSSSEPNSIEIEPDSSPNSSKTPLKKPKELTRELSYQQVYSCPACGSGELSAMAMMDVFSCSFCRHIFTANLQTQSVQLADSLQPMGWQWTGRRWRAAHQSDTKAALVWIFCVILTVTPVLLIAVSNYIFPPSGGIRFVVGWVALTGIAHSLISGWLLSEYHQWPWYVANRIRVQRIKERFI